MRGLVEPTGEGVRVDSGIAAGSAVGSDYDPMLAKVIAWGDDRAEALHRLDHALAETAVLGVTTNIGFLRRLLADPDVVAGRSTPGSSNASSTRSPPRRYPRRCSPPPPSRPPGRRASESDPWQQLTGWRHGGPAAIRRGLE